MAAVEKELEDLKDNVKTLTKNLDKIHKRIESLEKTDAELMANGGHDGPAPKENTLHEVVRKEEKAGPLSSTVTRTFISSQTVTKSTSYHPIPEDQEIVKSLVLGSPNTRSNQIQLGIRKTSGDDHLGLTVEEREGQLVVTEVKDSFPLAKKGLLQGGDIILAVNGINVKTQQEISEAAKSVKDGMILTIIPSPRESYQTAGNDYIKACFDYDPSSDDAIPCKEIGLNFRVGEVLQVISRDDDKWWQARKVSDWFRTGLIPSREFEESRRAVSHKATQKEKQKFDEHEVRVYEDVAKLSPYGRKVLVLLGAPGVGRRTLKSRLLQHSPSIFASVVPYTSRKPRENEKNGREYNFVSKSAMEADIQEGNFLEWGEFNGNMYGTKLDSVRDVIRSGRVCVLDCSPQALKHLYNKNFMPHVVLIAPPPLEELIQLHRLNFTLFKAKSEEELKNTSDAHAVLEKFYKPYVDLTLVNRNAEVTFRRLLDAMETLKTQSQWVPSGWLFE